MRITSWTLKKKAAQLDINKITNEFAAIKTKKVDLYVWFYIFTK